MFRQKPQAIPGDVVGEALVEVRERIELYGWRTGGDYDGPYSPMCLGNHLAVVARTRSWLFLGSYPMGIALMMALGFNNVERLFRWNDSLGQWLGKRLVLRRINAAIKAHNEVIGRKAEIVKGMDIGKPVREIEAPAPVEIPLEEPEVEIEKETEREPEKVPA